MKDYENGKRIQSYIFTAGKTFFVSTAYRDDEGFFETFAWEVNDKYEKGDWVADGTRGSNNITVAIKQHEEVCRALLLYGKYEYDNTNDCKIKL